MSDKSKIDWTDATYNPIVGCSKISEGCVNCFAERAAAAPRLQQFEQYKAVIANGRWSGKAHLVESVLDKPLHWRKPRKIFVCSMGDLFHESVPITHWKIDGGGMGWLDRIFCGVIGWTPQHTYQILTKRIDREKIYLDKLYRGLAEFHKCKTVPPFKNLWLGVTVENSNHLSRITMLGNIRAAVHFVSFEPLLGPINMFAAPGWQQDIDQPFRDTVQWVIVGPETGPSARPCDNDWIRRIVKDCERAGVACFVKKIVGPDGKAIHPGPEWPREFPEVKA